MKKERKKFSTAFEVEVTLDAIHGVLIVPELAQSTRFKF
jgi:hypothetical protein